MKEISLTKGKVALVDEADFARVSQYAWQAKKSGNGPWYAATTVQDATGKRNTVWMHKLVLGTDLFVDHIDHDGLNNTRSNLRPATKQQNRQFSKKPSTRTYSSQFKGVSWKKTHQRWLARIVVDGHPKHIGYFHSELDAAKAYDQAALKYFKQFAYLNFSNGDV